MEFRDSGLQFLDGRLQFLVHGLQFFICGLLLLMERFDLFSGRQGLLLGELQRLYLSPEPAVLTRHALVGDAQ